MTRTRIVVPTTAPELSAPHFDEATIITARPVAQARAVERSRLLLWMLPTALAAAVFGALSALGVNYYEKRQSPVTQLEVKAEPQTDQLPPAEPQSAAPIFSEPAGGAVATESATSESEGSRPQTEAADQKESSSDKDRARVLRAKEPVGSPAAKPTSPAATDYGKNGSSNDPGRLVRKRRVHPVTEASPPESRLSRKNRGAGRIQDIFEGPNHQ